ncbi:hypothetical protein MMC20_003923 [Loxospora ochrophaea]|nr:hypothetical protein [Loxospora ochrophaea]
MNFIGTLTAACGASIAAYLGWVLPSNTLSLINQDLGDSPNITWVAVVWTLSNAIAYTLVGRLSDIFGRRYFIIGTNVIGLIGCIIGATAKEVNTLIAANTFNGIAAAGQLNFPVIIGELVPNRARGPFNSAILFSSMPFAVFGPVIARSLILNTARGWRWSFYLGIIVTSVSIIGFVLFYWPPQYGHLHQTGKTKRQQLLSLDYVGIVLFAAGLALFLIGISYGGTLYPWKSAHVIAPIVVGGCTIIAFCFWEGFSNVEYPLIPMRLFRNIKWVAIVIDATVASMIYYSMTVIWPTLVGSLFTTSVQGVGWMSCAVGGGLLLGQLLGGFGIRFIPRMRLQMTIAAVLVAIFVASVASATPTARSRTVTFLLLGTISCGYIENLTQTAVALVWEPSAIGLVTSVLGSIRAIGGSVATAIYSSILSNKLGVYLPRYVAPAALSAGLPESSLPTLLAGIGAGADLSTTVPGATPAVLAAIAAPTKQAFQESFKVVFLATIAFSACLLAASVISPDMEKYMTGEVARRLVRGGEQATGGVVGGKAGGGSGMVGGKVEARRSEKTEEDTERMEGSSSEKVEEEGTRTEPGSEKATAGGSAEAVELDEVGKA